MFDGQRLFRRLAHVSDFWLIQLKDFSYLYLPLAYSHSMSCIQTYKRKKELF